MNKISFLLVLLFVSCSSDDSKQEIDPFIGEWKPTKKTILNSSDTIYFDECQQKSRYQFNADGTIVQWDIYSMKNSNVCYREIQLISGKWTRTVHPDNNTYVDITLLDNLIDSTYHSLDAYEINFYENHDNLIWSIARNSTSESFLFLERIE